MALVQFFKNKKKRKNKRNQNSASCLNAAKKEKSVSATADARVVDSGAVFSAVGDNLAGKVRHSENDAPTTTRHLCFSATTSSFHYPLNAREQGKYHR